MFSDEKTREWYLILSNLLMDFFENKANESNLAKET
jgi:hypothetical protein